MSQRHRLARPRRARAGLVLLAAATLTGLVGVEWAGKPTKAPVGPYDGTVTIDTSRQVNTLHGSQALGAGVDGLERGEIDKTWHETNLRAMQSAGFGSISYRLRTELGVKAWHWNPHGTFSEGDRGYWTSDATMPTDPGVSYGYHLPRRGNTIDQANNDGYSRIADGSTRTYWKSNPYLDPHFTGEPEHRNRQWMMVAFPHAVPVDTIRIAWGDPFATRVHVQYWTGNDALFPIQQGALWRDFPSPAARGKGQTQVVRVAATPLRVQFIRVLLGGSSRTAVPGSKDVRDRLGFAVREISVYGNGTDHVHHAASQRQTIIYTSSTDPWHRASDIDRDYEHASFARVYASGLTRSKPMMIPVPVLYGVPEDAAALVRYLKAMGFPFHRVEMGEEPDGQLATPEDYGALYLQVGRAIRAVDPTLELGGPGYQTTIPDWVTWPDASGSNSWTGRFVAYLKRRDAMAYFDFFSFEWYPFDDVCADPATPLAQHPGMLTSILRRQERAGLPRDIPKVITEYGYSAYAGQVELELPGAMVNVESALHFLALGGETSYFYGLEPNWVFQEDEGKPCDTWGNLMLFQFYNDWKIRPLVTFHAAQLVTRQWAQPGDGDHAIFAASSDLFDARSRPLVTAYATRRPDGRLAVLLLNKDPKRSLTVRVVAGGRPLTVPADVYQYSGEQWDWVSLHGKRNGGYPLRNDPPAHTRVDEAGSITLPPYSITVLRTEHPHAP